MGAFWAPFGRHLGVILVTLGILGGVRGQREPQGRPKDAIWSILAKSSSSPCQFKLIFPDVFEVPPFWHLFGDLFFVEISFEAVGCSMGSEPCFSPVGSKVTSGHFLSVPVFHEKHVFHTFHCSL